MWRADEANFGDTKDTLQVLITTDQGNYCFPKGFSFDQNYREMIEFSPESKNYNGNKKMAYLERYINKLLASEQTDHAFLMFGCDFAFTNAKIDYESMERVMNHWNAAYPNVKMFYSTPNAYLKQVRAKNDEFKKQKNDTTSLAQKQEPVGFGVRRDDGFPYEMEIDKFWSGYYTTRPLYKSFMRQTSAHFHGSLELSAMMSLQSRSDVDKQLTTNSTISSQAEILMGLGTALHHDAITGTAPQYTS